MRREIKIVEYFSEVETTEEYDGYVYSVGEALTIVIVGSLCGLRNVNQIHQWAASERVSGFLREHFGINRIPCYYWLLCLLKLIQPESLNRCFIKWAQTFVSVSDQDSRLTLSCDGKTIRSTEKMDRYDNPLHIVSAQLAELGVTIGQKTVHDKSNEIPAVRELIGLLNIEGCVVVADALNCQKETAKAVIEGRGEYLLSVKDNQQTLKEDIEDYVQDGDLQKTMETFQTVEKNRGRIEQRTAYTSSDIAWLYGKAEWANLACIGAVNRQCSSKKGETNEWHYYIASQKLSAQELLRRTRAEWSVETMHWLLDVHFDEDFCRVEDENVQQSLNMVRKIALNSIKRYKEKKEIKRPLSKIMFDCLLDCDTLLPIFRLDEN